MTSNTVLVTGGGSGIGRGLAEAFAKRGNRVIIAGRRLDALRRVCVANPGMEALPLDMSDAADVERFADELVGRFPDLNMLVNNAGIMEHEELTSDELDADVAERTVTTNLLGPIRLTIALLPHLRKQAHASIINVSSGLAFVPLAAFPTYSATKAAIHSYSISLRHQLRDTNVRVAEIAPPYVRTGLTGDHQANDPRAMPLEDFVAETMANFDSHPDAPENLVTQVGFLRNAEREGRFEQTFAAVNAPR